jgi:hypothetical protein
LALHWEVAFGAIVEGLHVTCTEVMVGGCVIVCTVIVALPDLVVSSVLVAVTVIVAGEAGAVNTPPESIMPPLADHGTWDLKLPVP